MPNAKSPVGHLPNVSEYVNLRVSNKIVGHSLGGGTAALLTYVLREQKELSTATCVTFAPDFPSPRKVCIGRYVPRRLTILICQRKVSFTSYNNSKIDKDNYLTLMKRNIKL